MKIQLDCIITRAVQGSKNAERVYFDVHDLDNRGRGSFSVDTSVITVDRLLAERGAVRIVGEVTPIKYEQNQILRFDKLTITPLGAGTK